MLGNDSGATTVVRAHGVLSGILADAVKAKRIAVNPAKGVENLPEKTARRRVYLSADDVHRLADESGEHRPLVLVLAYCGLRCGEAIGLRVRDVKFCGGGSRCRERRPARRPPHSRPNQEPGGQARPGPRIRPRRAVHPVRGQGTGRSRLSGPRQWLPTAAEVVEWLVHRSGEAGQGTEDHAARSQAHLRVAGGVGRGECPCAAADARAQVRQDHA